MTPEAILARFFVWEEATVEGHRTAGDIGGLLMHHAQGKRKAREGLVPPARQGREPGGGLGPYSSCKGKGVGYTTK